MKAFSPNYLRIVFLMFNCSIAFILLLYYFGKNDESPQPCTCEDHAKQSRSTIKETKSAILEEDWKHNKLPVVFYNRVPKCGSSTTFVMMKSLAAKLNFTVLNINMLHLHPSISEQFQEETVLYMNALPQNTIVIRHLFFLDFGRFNSKYPAYINVIRDPLERFTTHYYFVQNGFVHNPYSKEKQSKVSLDECIKQQGMKCLESANPRTSTLAFFCGNEEECISFKSQNALERAKENVEKYYLAIGLTEDFNNTFRLFQALLPSHFTRWEDISLAKATKKFKTYNRLPLKEESKPMLRKHLRYEIEFYEFVKKRFYRQLAELKQNNKENVIS